MGQLEQPPEGSNGTASYQWNGVNKPVFFGPEDMTVAEGETGDCVYMAFVNVNATAGFTGKSCDSAEGTIWYRDGKYTELI